MPRIAARLVRADTSHRMGAMQAGSRDESDEALMLAYARGDADAFVQLYGRHKGPVYRYLRRHGTDPAAADELHQDVWLRVVRARQRYAPEARFTTWLYTLARNRLVDHWRSGRSTRMVPLDEDSAFEEPVAAAPGAGTGGDDPLVHASDAQLAQRLRSAVSGLPGAQRDAFLLHVEAGLSLEEIARIAGAPAETIKSRLRYAYGRLRAALEDLR